MPGAITVKDRAGMAYFLKDHVRGPKVRLRFHTLPGRIEIDKPGTEDTVARFLVEVPEEVEQQRALRQMEYVVRAFECGAGFTPTKIESKTFHYTPPEKPDYSKGVEATELTFYNRMIRDYGTSPGAYRSMTYEIRGEEAQKLVERVLESPGEVRYCERLYGDRDTSGIYFAKDNPMSGFAFAASTVQAGRGDFTDESFAFMAADELHDDLNFELEEDWLTIGDHGLPIQD